MISYFSALGSVVFSVCPLLHLYYLYYLNYALSTPIFTHYHSHTPSLFISSHALYNDIKLLSRCISMKTTADLISYQYMYALLSEVDSGPDSGGKGDVAQCYGPNCFRLTFWLCSGCCFISGIGVWLVGRRWKV